MTTANNTITRFGADDLYFDIKNPRLVEAKLSEDTNQTDILNILWVEKSVNELVMSILANGFFETEAMLGVREDEKVIIVEGNRRLAAVKSILHPSFVKNDGMKKYEEGITNDLRDSLSNNLPVILLENREDAWRYIGFKHVKGASKWDSFAKAKYIATVHNEYGVSIENIARQIGDSNKLTLKLYQGLMVLQQADRDTHFKIEDVYNNRVYFSHLYTAIGYEEYQNYLGIDPNCQNENPIPAEKKAELEHVMIWLFGSKEEDIRPIIQSQNPDLRNLAKVLSNPDATQILINNNSLELAFDKSFDGEETLSNAINEAQINLEKALSKVSYYKGGRGLLENVIMLANTADKLYSSMKETYNENNNIVKQRSID